MVFHTFEAQRLNRKVDQLYDLGLRPSFAPPEATFSTLSLQNQSVRGWCPSQDLAHSPSMTQHTYCYQPLAIGSPPLTGGGRTGRGCSEGSLPLSSLGPHSSHG